jgi:hypothetical protein
MRVGLVTIFQVPNYGSVLQAFATQYVLEKNGVDCDIINYHYPNEWHFAQGTPRPNKIKALIRKVFPSKKESVLEHFRHDYLNLTRKYFSLDELQSANWDKYDAFISGSDQIWNYRFTHGDSFFMLSFVPDDKPRISIASSFAQKSIPDSFRSKYHQELSKYRSLSVREQNGVSIIKNEIAIDKPVEVILDPTLLLDRNEWLSIVGNKSSKVKEPYILLYLWKYAFEPRPYIYDVVKYFQKKMGGQKMLVLEGYEKNDMTKDMNLVNCSTSTIEEFMWLFANASLVVTSSFHGTAFALNFGVPLVSVVPQNSSDDRMTTLCQLLDVENCLAPIGKKLSLIEPSYDILSQQKRLNDVRQGCLNWIKRHVLD